MTPRVLEQEPEVHEATEVDTFDLDIRIIELGGAADLLDLTDDGCGSTCPKACVTDPG